MARSLDTPITDDGLEGVQFFNGRVLSAVDMQDEQRANRRRRAQVAQSVGTGVVHGLQVAVGPGSTPQSLRVREGLAISPGGDAVELFTDVEVSVVDIDTETEPLTTGQFVRCDALPSVRATGAGAYLLVACRASAPRGQVPRVDPIGGDGRAGSCGPRYAVEGVRFRLVYLDHGDDGLVPAAFREELRDLMSGRTLSAAEQSRQRNLLAHWCLGTNDQRTMPADLYDRLSSAEAFEAELQPYGPIDALRVPETDADLPRLSKEDVPLAFFVWDEAIQFVDMWAVRRRVHRTGGSPEAITERRRAEGEARFRQFQAHIEDLPANETSGTLISIEMSAYIRYLPPVALVPLVNALGRPGVAPETFLGSHPAAPPVYVEGRQLPPLIHHAVLAPPVDLQRHTALRVYRVRESDAVQEVPETVTDRPSGSATPYLVLASAGLPRLGDPRYGLSHWDYAHFRDTAIDD